MRGSKPGKRILRSLSSRINTFTLDKTKRAELITRHACSCHRTRSFPCSPFPGKRIPTRLTQGQTHVDCEAFSSNQRACLMAARALCSTLMSTERSSRNARFFTQKVSGC